MFVCIVYCPQVLSSQENVSQQTGQLAKLKLDSKSDVVQREDSPPKAPRSAFMCFTEAKKEEIMSKHGVTAVSGNPIGGKVHTSSLKS